MWPVHGFEIYTPALGRELAQIINVTIDQTEHIRLILNKTLRIINGSNQSLPVLTN